MAPVDNLARRRFLDLESRDRLRKLLDELSGDVIDEQEMCSEFHACRATVNALLDEYENSPERNTEASSFSAWLSRHENEKTAFGNLANVRLHIIEQDPIDIDIDQIASDVATRTPNVDAVFNLRLIILSTTGLSVSAFLLPFDDTRTPRLPVSDLARREARPRSKNELADPLRQLPGLMHSRRLVVYAGPAR